MLKYINSQFTVCTFHGYFFHGFLGSHMFCKFSDNIGKCWQSLFGYGSFLCVFYSDAC